jgi:hypothetical protein
VRQYRTLVLPACHHLTDAQAALLGDHLEAGGTVLAIGEFGTNLEAGTRRRLLEHSGTTQAPALDPAGLAGGPQLVAGPAGADFAVCVQRVAAGAAVHVIRYDYDDAADAVPALPQLDLELRLEQPFTRAAAFSPGGELGVSLAAEGTTHRLRLADVPVYGVVLLQA